MKASPWLLGAVGAAVATGVAFLGAGFLRPGQISPPEKFGGSSKSFLAEARKRVEAVRVGRGRVRQEADTFSGFSGTAGEHRVFVSAQLVYLPENPEPVQPLDRKMKTEDGIEVGWKMRYGFNPADPGVKNADPDGDGFTNLEEFSAQPPTDPTRPEDSPAKESKLKSRSGEPLAMAVSFAEKSGGLFTLRFQVDNKRAQFKGRPGDSFWVLAGPEGVEVFSDEKQMTTTRAKAKQAGRNGHVIPLSLVSYQEKLEKIKDERAGGLEVEVDNSILVLERKDALGGEVKLSFSTPQRPQLLRWDVADIRFFTPAAGGTELGPFRVGEIFFYEGMEFAVVGRDGKKIQLLHRGEGEKLPFWVPPEASASAPSGRP